MPETKPADSNVPSPGAEVGSVPRDRRAAQHDEASRGTVKWLMGLIVAWGVVAAAGVVRYDYRHDQLNLIKPLIVIACTIIVVGGWQLALRRRASRSARDDR